MQGNLNEIDIRSILLLIELGQRTGELFIEAYSGSGTHRHRHLNGESSWFVFCANGKIIYAADSKDSDLSRLRDYLHRYKLDEAIDRVALPNLAATNAPEYGYLWTLLENLSLTPSQGRSILKNMVNETLFDLLGLHQGSFVFDMGPALAPQLAGLEIGSLVSSVAQQVQEWKQLHPHIQSPDWCPAVSDTAELEAAVPAATFNTLTRWADGKTSIRRIARYLGRDILSVAKAVYPYVQQGLVQLSPPISESIAAPRREFSLRSAADETPRVVCIDDEATVRKAVEFVLNPHGYAVSSIGNPLKSLSLVFQLKPDLILCDIAMPEPDGYEICAMLRRSTAFRQTPIIMLTGKDGFIDRVRARMVGATDYLTKPFSDRELRLLVEGYIGPGRPDRPEAERLLAEDLGDGDLGD